MTSSKTILVVDDDTALLIALQRRLEHAGYRVLTATNGTEALQRARDNCVDVVTLDVGLPGNVSGLEIARALREDPYAAHIPIIFITGQADAGFTLKCQTAGGKYFLAKPYDSDLLLHILRGVLGGDESAEVQRISRAKRRQPVR